MEYSDVPELATCEAGCDRRGPHPDLLRALVGGGRHSGAHLVIDEGVTVLQAALLHVENLNRKNRCVRRMGSSSGARRTTVGHISSACRGSSLHAACCLTMGLKVIQMPLCIYYIDNHE